MHLPFLTCKLEILSGKTDSWNLKAWIECHPCHLVWFGLVCLTQTDLLVLINKMELVLIISQSCKNKIKYRDVL